MESHVIFDVAGWYSDVPAGNDGRFESLVPARILDTRNGNLLEGLNESEFEKELRVRNLDPTPFDWIWWR